MVEQSLDGLALGEPRKDGAVAAAVRALLDVGLKDAGEELGPRQPVALGGGASVGTAWQPGADLRLSLP